MRISEDCINLIKQFEGCKLIPYKDIAGIWTMGYGHTGDDVIPGEPITQEDADYLLEKDLQKFEIGVLELVQDSVTQGQLDALVSFSYNLGLKTLRGSTLLRDFLNGDVQGAAQQFPLWDHSGGVEIPGLLRRRLAEQQLFLS